MAEDNLILKNWKQQEKIFIENLFISRICPTKDSVHDLRVAVKKMRSYLRLKEHLAGGDWKEPFVKIKTLFNSFGRLRDYDMSLELSRKSERKWQLSLLKFKEYLSVNKKLTRRWAKQEAIKFNESGSNTFHDQFNSFDNLPGAEVAEKIFRLSSARLKRVKNLSKHFQKNLHEIRKQLKDLFYWLKICPKEQAENFIDLKKLDGLLKYLGICQDHFIFIEKIKQYKKDVPKVNEEKKMLKDLEKKIDDSQKEMRDKAIKKWKELETKKSTVKAALRTSGSD